MTLTWTSTFSPTPSFTQSPSFTASPSFTPPILGGFPTVTPTPRIGDQDIEFAVFDWAGRQVWRSGSMAANGAAGIGMSPQLFLSGGGALLGLFAGDVVYRWDGIASDGIELPTGDYLLKLKVREKSGAESTYSAVFTMVLKREGLLGPARLYPQPARDHVSFDLTQVPSGIPVFIEVWNLAGELVKTDTTLSGPGGKLIWRLDTGSGQAISTGLYVVVMSAQVPNQVIKDRRSFKLVVLRK